MTVGLHLPLRRRPTPGALYVAGTAGFAVLLLALVAARLVDPAAIALVGVPLGPAGVVAAAALPLFTAPPTLALSVLVVAGALAIGVVNVLLVTLIGWIAAGRPILRR
ncbi:hypothetical protein [Amnibacterium setariae]|uniref:Uncharacterized protein n=1 Tax=Amnibacterium setariae TaxID=2306585 RepID=A0A3A1U5R6_9MICO|nr:hypothetical protein [Amnibacterium setariae]RIX30797.1 hypothetical protein D1781_05205 [Amnibacterium setariae]